MQKRALILITVFALAAAAPGCQSNANKPAAPAGPRFVDGVFWQLVEVGGQPAEPADADGHAARFRLNDADRRVTGFGGVNQLTGPYELNGKALKFGKLATTRRAGPEPLMRQESALTQAMSQTASWRPAGPDEIELLDAARRPLARFKRAAG